MFCGAGRSTGHARLIQQQKFRCRSQRHPGFEDTQCGFKCFAAAAAEDVFGVQVFDGMSFDVEVLYIAVQRGYRVQEIPIDWYYRAESRVNPIADPLRMLADILKIRRNWRQGRYASKPPTDHAPRTTRLSPGTRKPDTR